MRNDGITNTCPNCYKNFISSISPIAQLPNARIKGNTERCPQCNSVVSSPSGTTVMTKKGVRLIAEGTSVTPTHLPDLQPTTGPIYFSVGNGDIQSPVWKIWSNNDNVYLACLNLKGWKASFHKSGQDNIGFTDEYFKKIKNQHPPNTSRHFYQATRQTPELACAVRIMRLQIILNEKSEFSWKSEVKSKHVNNCKIFNPIDEKYFAFDILYTEGHPNQYMETKGFHDIALASYNINCDEWFVICPVYYDKKFSIVNSSMTVFRHNNKLETMEMTFGVTDRNAFSVIMKV